MANGQPGLPLVAAVPYGQVNGGTPPLVNGRRMTSNLVSTLRRRGAPS
jgi:hypothetical protein